MGTSRIRISSALATVAAAALLAGCGQDSIRGEGSQVTAPRVTASPTSLAPSTTWTSAPSVPAELTAEESLRITPPAPRALRATAGQGAVELTWQAPPPVTVPHTYGDTVVRYRVFRAVGSGPFVLLGTTESLSFSDATAAAGSAMRYAVSDVREHGVESGWSDVVSVTVP